MSDTVESDGVEVAVDAANTKSTDSNRIFLSYASKDEKRVRGLRDMLIALGHEVWFAPEDIRSGTDWESALQAELDKTNAGIVFWTRHAAKSKWVKREYTRLLERHGALVMPVSGDETGLPKALAARDWIDFVPLLNELLAKKRDLEADGFSRKEVARVMLKRLREAGIPIEGVKGRRLLGFFGYSRWVGLVAGAVLSLQAMGWAGRGAAAVVGNIGVAAATLIGTAAATNAIDELRFEARPGAPSTTIASVDVKVRQGGSAGWRAPEDFEVEVGPQPGILEIQAGSSVARVHVPALPAVDLPTIEARQGTSGTWTAPAALGIRLGQGRQTVQIRAGPQTARLEIPGVPPVERPMIEVRQGATGSWGSANDLSVALGAHPSTLEIRVGAELASVRIPQLPEPTAPEVMVRQVPGGSWSAPEDVEVRSGAEPSRLEIRVGNTTSALRVPGVPTSEVPRLLARQGGTGGWLPTEQLRIELASAASVVELRVGESVSTLEIPALPRPEDPVIQVRQGAGERWEEPDGFAMRLDEQPGLLEIRAGRGSSRLRIPPLPPRADPPVLRVRNGPRGGWSEPDGFDVAVGPGARILQIRFGEQVADLQVPALPAVRVRNGERGGWSDPDGFALRLGREAGILQIKQGEHVSSVRVPAVAAPREPEIRVFDPTSGRWIAAEGFAVRLSPAVQSVRVRAGSQSARIEVPALPRPQLRGWTRSRPDHVPLDRIVLGSRDDVIYVQALVHSQSATNEKIYVRRAAPPAPFSLRLLGAEYAGGDRRSRDPTQRSPNVRIRGEASAAFAEVLIDGRATRGVIRGDGNDFLVRVPLRSQESITVTVRTRDGKEATQVLSVVRVPAVR